MSCLINLVQCLGFSTVAVSGKDLVSDPVTVSQGSLNVSQDVSNPFFSASTPVDVLTRYDPDKASYMSQEGDLEISLSRAVAEGPFSSGTSLPQMSFRDLKGTISCFDRSG